jgi:putative tryptophan/tyrosine transport system substrate-binding protein
MNERRRLILLAGALLAPGLRAQPAKIRRIGVLSIGTDPKAFGRWQPFVDAMRGLNYVEGRNVAFLWGFSAGDFGTLPGYLESFLKAGVEVIVVTGTREIRAAMKATSTVPIVMTLAADPIKEGFIASLARPGGNVTGLTSLVPGLPQKYVQLLREVVPNGKRFAIVAVAPNPIPEIREEFAKAAQLLGVTLPVVQFSSPADFERALGQARKDGAQGIIHPLDGGTSAHRPALAQAALKHQLPGIYWDAAYVDAGGLMTYSISFSEQVRAAATYVDKLLRGARPADLPVQLPARVETVINMKTARAFGVTIPRSVLLRADRLIE